jgi:APA family basic amino acid/polyamine antiporter
LFFHRIAAINRRSVPAAALWAQAIWTIFLTLPRTVNAHPAPGVDPYGNVYTQLLEYIVSADLVFYILLVVAVIVLRKTRPDAPRPYRTWGYPLVPIVSVVLAAFLIVDLAYLAPATSGIGYLLVLTGIPVYFVWRRGFSADRSA